MAPLQHSHLTDLRAITTVSPHTPREASQGTSHAFPRQNQIFSRPQVVQPAFFVPGLVVRRAFFKRESNLTIKGALVKMVDYAMQTISVVG